MERAELHKKIDSLLDRLETVADKAEDGLDKIKDRAAELLDKSDDEKDRIKLDAENAVVDVQRSVCRGKNWLRERLTDAELEADGLAAKLEQAKTDHDKASAEKYTEAMEDYAGTMLAIAQEASDEATDAVQAALQARKDFKEKFGA